MDDETGIKPVASEKTQADPKELEELQQLSDQYRPGDDQEGKPFISEKIDTAKIADEYAEADDVNYRKKTAGLSTNLGYGRFREAKRDGGCGWRSIAFAYFETLLNLTLSNPSKYKDLLLNEHDRVAKLKDDLAPTLPPLDLLEDLIEATFEMFNTLIAAVIDEQARAVDGSASNGLDGAVVRPQKPQEILRERFNVRMSDAGIVTHMRFLTSAQLRAHADDFVDFLIADSAHPTIDAYCSNEVETSKEIEELSLQALQDVLLKPAGLGLEVLYLDRSPGEHIDVTRRLEPDPEKFRGVEESAMVRLLYRIGHYDIVYKEKPAGS